METRFGQRAAGIDLARNSLGAQLSLGLQGNKGGGRIVTVAGLQRSLQGSKFLGFHECSSLSGATSPNVAREPASGKGSRVGRGSCQWPRKNASRPASPG